MFQVYILTVRWSDGNVNIIYRQYREFIDLQVSIVYDMHMSSLCCKYRQVQTLFIVNAMSITNIILLKGMLKRVSREIQLMFADVLAELKLGAQASIVVDPVVVVRSRLLRLWNFASPK